MAESGVALLFGPMLIGLVLNAMLYGVMVTQMLTYYRQYTQDARWMRYFILYLFILETAVVVIECGIVFQPLVLEYGTPQAVTDFPTLLPGDALMIALVSGPIQVFTAWRIKVISDSYILPACICFLSFASFSLGLTSGIRVLLAGKFSQFAQLTGTTTAWLITTALCDIVIAGGMTWALLSRKTGFKYADAKINRIVTLSIETGSVTAVVALLDLCLALGIPNKAVNFAVDFPLSTLYTCSVLALLNSRESNNPRHPSQDPERAPAGRNLQVLSSSSGQRTGTGSPSPSYALRSLNVNMGHHNHGAGDFESKPTLSYHGEVYMGSPTSNSESPKRF
ncbi:hypothetical protein C8F01DRAFT_1371779 [Mycena amicta]|nr:hypothetical protein C8F01DRAFT_1371779 [Mycena amicta]